MTQAERIEKLETENKLLREQNVAFKKALGIIRETRTKMRQTAIDQKRKDDRKKRRKVRKAKRCRK